MTQSLDEVLLANLKDKDDFFEGQRTFLAEYLVRVKEATAKADVMTASHKSLWKNNLILLESPIDQMFSFLLFF